MQDEKPYGVLTDAQLVGLAPLIEPVRPHGKTEPHELRRTLEVIIWRHGNGAKRRAVPAELGPRWMAAQCWNRWFHLGVWERLLALAQERSGSLVLPSALNGNAVHPAPIRRPRLLPPMNYG
jgi:transposase